MSNILEMLICKYFVNLIIIKFKFTMRANHPDNPQKFFYEKDVLFGDSIYVVIRICYVSTAAWQNCKTCLWKGGNYNEHCRIADKEYVEKFAKKITRFHLDKAFQILF